jgi:hypothetical protein
MLRFLKVLEIPDFQSEESAVKQQILERVQQRISQNKITSVKLRDVLSPEEEQLIFSWNLQGVYPSENGLYINPEELTQKDIFANYYQNLF